MGSHPRATRQRRSANHRVNERLAAAETLFGGAGIATQGRRLVSGNGLNCHTAHPGSGRARRIMDLLSQCGVRVPGLLARGVLHCSDPSGPRESLPSIGNQRWHASSG